MISAMIGSFFGGVLASIGYRIYVNWLNRKFNKKG
jgi:hypothetical protein